MEAERRIGVRSNELGEWYDKFDARLDEMLQAIMAIKDRIQERGGATAMADTESCSALHEKEDTITERRSLKKVSPIRDYPTFKPLPQIEGLEFDSLEPRGGLDVHQAMATMDLDSGSHESHEEGEPQPISSSTTLVQTDGSLRNQKEEMVNSTDLQSYKLSSYQKSTSYLTVEISDAELERIVVPPRFIGKESDCVVFEFSDSQQLKKAEFLPTARQHVSVRELTVVLPISTCYSLSLLWLLNWFPRPMVKLKFMPQYDEEMGGEANVRWASARAGKDQIHVVVVEELGWSCDGDYGAYALSNLQELTMSCSRV